MLRQGSGNAAQATLRAMTSLTCSSPILRHAVVLVLSLGSAMVSAESPSGNSLPTGLTREDEQLSLHAAWEMAWSRWPGRRLLDAKTSAATAYREQGDSLLAAPPELLFRHQNDLIHDRQSLTETELGVEFPLWRFGQRRRVVDQADAYQRAIAADEQVQRWELAGMIRETFWAVHLARSDVRQNEATLKVFQALERDVSLRYDAGDAARQDLLLAEAERSRQQSELSKASVVQIQAEHAWIQLTGLERIPIASAEIPSESSDSDYPPLTAARRLLEEREAAIKSAEAAGAGSPRVLIGTRANTQFDQRTQTVTGAQLTLPFGGASHRAAQRAPLVLAHGEALTEVQRLELEVQAQRRAVVLAIRSARQLAAEAEAHWKLVSQHTATVRRAYELGEVELAQRLLSEQRLSDASQRVARSQLAIQHSLSRSQQVAGVLP